MCEMITYVMITTETTCMVNKSIMINRIAVVD